MLDMLERPTAITPTFTDPPAEITTTRIEIEATTTGERGPRFRVLFDGRVIVESSRDPERDACRALLAMGITGKLETFIVGGTFPRMRLDIERARKFSATESDTGIRISKWQAFAERADINPENAVSRRDVMVKQGRGRFPKGPPAQNH